MVPAMKAAAPGLSPLEAFRDRTMVFTGLDNFPATDQGDVRRAAPARRAGLHELHAPEADRRRRCGGGHDDRSDHRRTDLPRHEAAVAGSLRGPQRRRRRLRPRVRLRLHELAVVEEPDDAAAVGNESALRVRAVVRHRRHRRRAPGPQPTKIAAFSTA